MILTSPSSECLPREASSQKWNVELCGVFKPINTISLALDSGQEDIILVVSWEFYFKFAATVWVEQFSSDVWYLVKPSLAVI